MKRKEAIAILQDKHDECKAFYDLAAHPEDAYPGTKEYMEALQMALAALRGPTRERVERIRSHWITVVEINGRDCSKCAACQNGLDELEDAYSFCPRCGAPMTDEAVDIIMQRLEALSGEAKAN